MIGFDGFNKIFVCIVDSFDFKGESFSVGSPKNDNCVKVMFLFE